MAELQALWLDLQSPAIVLEILGLLLCLALAWGLSAALGGVRQRGSILFGRRLVDGVLFPSLAWLLAAVLQLGLSKFQHVAILKVALPALASLAIIRLIARVLSVTFPQSRGARILERGVSWMVWAVAVLWMTNWLPLLMQELDSLYFVIGKRHVAVSHVIEVIVTAGFSLVMALWLSATLEQRVLTHAFSDLSMRRVAANAMRVLLLTLGALFALSSLGFDLTTLSVLGGAFGVGIGLGLQKLAANYISGFVILLERSLRIGDFVRVDGFEGRVTDIKTRYTLVRASNGSEAVVPNEVLLTQRVENLSLESRHVLQSCTYWIGLDSDVPLVQRLLELSALAQTRVLDEPAPQALLMEVAPQGLRFDLKFWIDDPAGGQSVVQSQVNIAVLHALREAGVLLVRAPQEFVLRAGEK